MGGSHQATELEEAWRRHEARTMILMAGIIFSCFLLCGMVFLATRVLRWLNRSKATGSWESPPPAYEPPPSYEQTLAGAWCSL